MFSDDQNLVKRSYSGKYINCSNYCMWPELDLVKVGFVFLRVYLFFLPCSVPTHRIMPALLRISIFAKESPQFQKKSWKDSDINKPSETWGS